MSLERINPDDCLMDIDEAAWRRIVSKRGGCRCCISPPCHACVEPITEDELNSVGYTYEAPAARFPEVSCSQCGQSFGPGDSGFSHCQDHKAASPAQPVQPSDQWLPIETAPKNGAEIIMSNGKDVSAGSWFKGHDGTYDRDGAPNCDEKDACWMDWSGGMLPEPTHWMPLPPAPQPELQAANAALLSACRETRIRLLGLAGMERWVDMLSDAIEQATGSRS